MTKPSGIRFFVDHCVPESVAKVLESHGREVIRLRTKTAPDSPDSLVAAVAEANDAVLVTMDGDFKAIAARNGIGQRRHRRLSLLRFERCRESRAAERMRSALSLVDHEREVGNGAKDRRMFVVIGAEVMRTHR
jgi:predicted nuclease of predicted toxin-antitoxin system